MNAVSKLVVTSALAAMWLLPAAAGGPTPTPDEPVECVPLVFNAESGLADAKARIAKGEPVMLFMGLPSGVEVDGATGLPTASMGCIVTDDIQEYVSAHNAEITRALHAGELDSYLYTERLFTPESLREFSVAASWHPLGGKGGTARNEQRKCTVVRTESRGLCYLRVERDGEDQSLDEVQWRGAILPPRGFHRNQHGECDPMQVAFAHEGKTAVFRYVDGTIYFTYDIEGGRVMQSMNLAKR